MNDESTYYGDRFFLLRGFFLRFWFRLSYRFLSLLSFGHHWNNCLFWLQGETSKRHAQKACQPHSADHQRNNWWSTSLNWELCLSGKRECFGCENERKWWFSVTTCDPLSHLGLHRCPYHKQTNHHFLWCNQVCLSGKCECFDYENKRKWWLSVTMCDPHVTSRAQPWPIAQTNQSSPPVISQHHHSVFSTTRAIAAARCRRKGRQHGVH